MFARVCVCVEPTQHTKGNCARRSRPRVRSESSMHKAWNHIGSELRKKNRSPLRLVNVSSNIHARVYKRTAFPRCTCAHAKQTRPTQRKREEAPKHNTQNNNTHTSTHATTARTHATSALDDAAAASLPCGAFCAAAKRAPFAQQFNWNTRAGCDPILGVCVSNTTRCVTLPRPITNYKVCVRFCAS